MSPVLREIGIMSPLEELARFWREADRVVVLTGAGLSTASGIPDFRSPGGRWETYRPITIQEFLASEESRAAYWRYKGETWQTIQAAEPNAGHIALTRQGRLLANTVVRELAVACGPCDIPLPIAG